MKQEDSSIVHRYVAKRSLLMFLTKLEALKGLKISLALLKALI